MTAAAVEKSSTARELLISPHNDDEALFASYVCLAHRPKVITVLNGARKRHYPTPAARVAESAAAMRVLGCEYEHLAFPIDDGPIDWPTITRRLRRQRDPGRVWVPLPEPRGQQHHNRVAAIAHELWPGRLAYFATYTVDERGWPTRSTVGYQAPAELGWPKVKEQALGCYRSQAEAAPTAMHFRQPLDEYLVDELKLNLGGGINPLAGFVNLDKSSGWRFEDGLGCYPDGSVAAITVSHTLMYVQLQYWPWCFAEMARVLAAGGVLRITEDAIGAPGSSRPRIRPGAAVATSLELVLEQLAGAGLDAREVSVETTRWRDRTLMQTNYGDAPDVFFAEGLKRG